jgi:hypothetical protein
MTVGWHEIRQNLYDALPPDTVQLGRKVAGYDEDEQGVTVRFQVQNIYVITPPCMQGKVLHHLMWCGYHLAFQSSLAGT